jgi:hypothetical protein
VLPKVLGATILALSLYREQSGCLVVKETWHIHFPSVFCKMIIGT